MAALPMHTHTCHTSTVCRFVSLFRALRRYLSSGSAELAAALEAQRVLQLEEEYLAEERAAHGALPPWPLLAAAARRGCPAALLGCFAAEGDNVPHALQVRPAVKYERQLHKAWGACAKGWLLCATVLRALARLAGGRVMLGASCHARAIPCALLRLLGGQRGLAVVHGAALQALGRLAGANEG
eukprot:311633-Chlamydomonas_euryale.AAC.5